jgi:signal peptidase II
VIDRIFRGGNVVDFLHFEFFPQFPIFNIADCAVVLGAGILILYFLIDTVKERQNGKN